MITSNVSKQNPFVGPRPFERKDEDRFFGREREASELFSLVVSHRTLLVYAQSGAGKTSLINARLIPQLEKEGFEVFPVVRVQNPMTQAGASKKIRNIFIYNTLLNLGAEGFDPDELMELSLSDFLRQKQRQANINRRKPIIPRVLIFDQFEEIFNLYLDRWEDRKGFFEQISTAVEGTDFTEEQRQESPLWVIFVMREDYIAQLDPYLNIMPGKLRTRFRLERLRADTALQAITGPLKKSPRSFAPSVAEKLVDELLKIRMEITPGETLEVRGEFVEPVQLQLVCQSLWQELPDDVIEITESHLRNFGNVDEVLARFYDQAMKSAAEKAYFINENRLRTWCEEVLITSMGTRGTVYRGPEFTANIPNKAIDELENQHLIRAEFRAGARWYELTHDRFIGPIRASNKAYHSRMTGQLDKEELSQQALLAVTHGEQAWGASDFSEALRFYENANQLYERIGDQWGVGNTFASIGFIHSQIGKFDQALDDFQKALDLFEQINDQNSVADILARMGEIYEKKGDSSAADKLFRRLSKIPDKINDDSEAASFLAGMGEYYFSREEFDKAAELLTLALGRDPANIDLFERRAVAYWYWGEYPQAIEDFTKVIASSPLSFDAYSGRGQVLAEQGVELDQAVDDLNYSIKLGQRYGISVAYSRNGLGLAYGKKGKYDKALKEFEASINESPDNGWVYYNRALVYELMGRLDNAIRDYKTSLEKTYPSLNKHKRAKAEARLHELGAGVA